MSVQIDYRSHLSWSLSFFILFTLTVIMTYWMSIQYRIQWSLFFTTLYFKTALIIRPPILAPKVQFWVLLNLYFKTTCSIRPQFHGPMGGFKIEGPLYVYISVNFNNTDMYTYQVATYTFPTLQNLNRTVTWCQAVEPSVRCSPWTRPDPRPLKSGHCLLDHCPLAWPSTSPSSWGRRRTAGLDCSVVMGNSPHAVGIKNNTVVPLLKDTLKRTPLYKGHNFWAPSTINVCHAPSYQRTPL